MAAINQECDGFGSSGREKVAKLNLEFNYFEIVSNVMQRQAAFFWATP